MRAIDTVRAVVLTMGMWNALVGPSPAQPSPPAEPSPAVRLFFLSDLHSRHAVMDRFVDEANRERPALVLDGGDFVHDGTEAELRRAFADRERLESPWYVVRGNHDAELRGPFSLPPPEIPEFQAFDFRDVHFILLDNHAGVISDALFDRLEAELAAHSGKRILVVMHVPAVTGPEPAIVRLRHLLPYRLSSPRMRDPSQVERFMRLMERHRVLAVLAGHTHVPSHRIVGGVHYVVAGAAGGLTPGLMVGNEYLDILVQGREIGVRRVRLGDPPWDPVRFVVRAFRFYVELNGFNHAEQGWNYVPSASVQLKAAVRQVDSRAGEPLAVMGAASFERVLGGRGRQAFVGDIGLSAGSRELAGHASLGYKVRPVGDFNRNIFIAGSATANGGLLGASATAGVGAQLGLGLELRGLTAEVSRNHATNHRAFAVTLGRRY